LIDWRGNAWQPGSGNPAAHPNSRFTVCIKQCPTLSPEYENPHGVPISAILFGGRRSRVMPLVLESFDWPHGVLLGAIMGSETTAAATGKVGVLRRDPMAMLPFCGYNMADYFGHWLKSGRKMTNPPKIFLINWFRTDESGKFMWPGFGENIRVLKWIIDRARRPGQEGARETPVGFVPQKRSLELMGLRVKEENLRKLLSVDRQEWKAELEDARAFLDQFGTRMPQEIWQEFKRLDSAVSKP
jgi:phosphoenolpyruvate carboxykinase (GTP)